MMSRAHTLLVSSLCFALLIVGSLSSEINPAAPGSSSRHQSDSTGFAAVFLKSDQQEFLCKRFFNSSGGAGSATSQCDHMTLEFGPAAVANWSKLYGQKQVLKVLAYANDPKHAQSVLVRVVQGEARSLNTYPHITISHFNEYPYTGVYSNVLWERLESSNGGPLTVTPDDHGAPLSVSLPDGRPYWIGKLPVYSDEKGHLQHPDYHHAAFEGEDEEDYAFDDEGLLHSDFGFSDEEELLGLHAFGAGHELHGFELSDEIADEEHAAPLPTSLSPAASLHSEDTKEPLAPNYPPAVAASSSRKLLSIPVQNENSSVASNEEQEEAGAPLPFDEDDDWGLNDHLELENSTETSGSGAEDFAEFDDEFEDYDVTAEDDELFAGDSPSLEEELHEAAFDSHNANDTEFGDAFDDEREGHDDYDMHVGVDELQRSVEEAEQQEEHEEEEEVELQHTAPHISGHKNRRRASGLEAEMDDDTAFQQLHRFHQRDQEAENEEKYGLHRQRHRSISAVLFPAVESVMVSVMQEEITIHGVVCLNTLWDKEAGICRSHQAA